jgi:GntR family transcriptional repressor for pyruvate dehydrogenase complex
MSGDERSAVIGERDSGMSSSDMLSTPISRGGSPVSEVAKRLLGYLTSGEVQPGQRLPSERELAARFEVGRSAVREAMAALDLLGILIIRQGSGTYLNSVSTDLLPQVLDWGLMLGRPQTLDLVEARHQLEIATARLAAAKIGPDGVAGLGSKLEAMRAAMDDRQAFVDADIAFHLEVARIAENSVLSDILHSIRALLRVWITRAVSADGQVEVTMAEHTAVRDAIVDGDPAAAAAAMDIHMDRAGARLRGSLESG